MRGLGDETAAAELRRGTREDHAVAQRAQPRAQIDPAIDGPAARLARSAGVYDDRTACARVAVRRRDLQIVCIRGNGALAKHSAPAIDFVFVGTPLRKALRFRNSGVRERYEPVR